MHSAGNNFDAISHRGFTLDGFLCATYFLQKLLTSCGCYMACYKWLLVLCFVGFRLYLFVLLKFVLHFCGLFKLLDGGLCCTAFNYLCCAAMLRIIDVVAVVGYIRFVLLSLLEWLRADAKLVCFALRLRDLCCIYHILFQNVLCFSGINSCLMICCGCFTFSQTFVVDMSYVFTRFGLRAFLACVGTFGLVHDGLCILIFNLVSLVVCYTFGFAFCVYFVATRVCGCVLLAFHWLDSVGPGLMLEFYYMFNLQLILWFEIRLCIVVMGMQLDAWVILRVASLMKFGDFKMIVLVFPQLLACSLVSGGVPYGTWVYGCFNLLDGLLQFVAWIVVTFETDGCRRLIGYCDLWVLFVGMTIVMLRKFHC
eukprot:gene2771-1756_t